MSEITLFYFPLSSCSRKVLFSLYEKNIKFKSVIIDLPSREQKSSDFLMKNPYGQVPVLGFDNEYIYDSSIILDFLEEYFPVPALLPTNPLKKAIVKKHTQYADQFFYPAISVILAEFRVPPNQRNLEKMKHYLDIFYEMHLPYLDKLVNVSKGSFLFGDLSLADIAFSMGLIRLQEVMDDKLNLTLNQQSWLQKIQSLESYQKLLTLSSQEKKHVAN